MASPLIDHYPLLVFLDGGNLPVDDDGRDDLECVFRRSEMSLARVCFGC